MMSTCAGWWRASGTVAALLLLAACSAGPDYQRPEMAVPTAFKEAAPASSDWKPSTPRDAAVRGAWWSVYDDPILDSLERQVDVSNQTLKGSEAAYRLATATVRAARAGLFPTVGATSFADRQGNGGGSKTSSSSSSSAKTSSTITQFDIGGTLSWDLDVWGRIRRAVEGDIASAQASAGDLASARLLVQATLATDYLELRIADELKRLLDAAATAYTQSLQITRNQYASGVAARSDVAQAETQLKTTQALAINVGVQRAQLEHAIAVLIGKPPAEVTIVPIPLTVTVPTIPAAVPSALLERRPDIAAAERRVAAANAQIGVAQAAYYPDLTLSGSITYASSAFAGLLGTTNRVWSLGPQLAQTVFNGGLTGAQVDEARATWEQNTASYRQTVLTAFQQVEDELSALRVLEAQAAVEAEAVQSAQEAERLILNQYKAGTVAYTSVVTAQTAALTNRQTALTVFENRLTASVTLIQALGGGWDSAQLPADDHLDDAPMAADPIAPPSLLDRIGSAVGGVLGN